MAKIEINDQFANALHFMEETNQSLFITGKAGTGKSTLLAHFCGNTDKKPIVLAPTGVAALNVKGQTIHSFFNFYVDVTPQKIRDKKTKPRNPKLYKKLKTIIIDEVSMVRADLLDPSAWAGLNAFSRPVTRSSNRAPTFSSTSQPCMARFDS